MSRTASYQNPLPALLAVLATSILWGTTGTAATFAHGVSPLAIGAGSLGIGGILQALIVLPALKDAAPRLRAETRLLAVGAVCVMIYPLAFYSSMHLAGVAIGTVVSLASAPLAAGLLERIVLHKLLTLCWALAATCGVIGSLLLCLAKLTYTPSSLPPVLAGIGFGLLAGITYASYSAVCATLIGKGVERSAAMGSVFGLGGILLMPVLALSGAPLLASSNNFLVITYMALIPMFLGYVLFGIGLQHLSASTATTITLSEPAVATLLAVLVVGETLSGLGWLGLIIIGLSLMLLVLPAKRRTAPSRISLPPAQAE